MTTPTPDQAREALDRLDAYADPIFDVSDSLDTLRRFIDAHSAPVLCMCKDRPASECLGEWEPGCDLGANEKFVRVGKEDLTKVHSAPVPEQLPVIESDDLGNLRVTSSLPNYREQPEPVAWQEQPKREPLTACTWAQDGEDSDTWGTSCGQFFTLNEGSPADNDMRHCCYCGKSLDCQPHIDDAIERLTLGEQTK
jgi:hypothetical protein